MGSTIAEQLSALPRLTTGLRVDLDLVESPNVLESAALVLKDWIAKKARLFEIDPDWSSADCLIKRREFQLEWSTDANSIAFNLSHSDLALDGRTWIVEGSLKTTAEKAGMQIRYGYRQPRSLSLPASRAPKFISDVVKRVGATDPHNLTCVAELIGRENFNAFAEILFSQQRRLPIVVVSLDQRTGSEYANAETLAAFLCGIAHVYRMDPISAFLLTEQVGNERSVFHGGIRCYAPRFTNESSLYDHKLWTREAIVRLDATHKNGFQDMLLNHVFSTVTAEFEPFRLPAPSELRRQRTEREQCAAIEALPAVKQEVEPTAEQLDLPLEPSILYAPASFQQYGINPETGALEVNGHEITTVEKETALSAAIREVGGLYQRYWEGKVKDIQDELNDLNLVLRELRDENAQKSVEINRLTAFERKVQDLQDENNLLRGKYEAGGSPALNDFWESMNILFESAQTLTMEARRVHEQESQLEQQSHEIKDLKDANYRATAALQSMNWKGGWERSEALLPVDSWHAVVHNSQLEHKNLIHAPYLLERISDTPFNEALAESVYQLLGILNEMGLESNEDNSLTERGLALHQQYFHGSNARFSDESDTNKRHFKLELTFPDPVDPSKRLECSWHGKITQERFRVHFEWPRPKGQKEIKVVYFGPKLTKH